MWLEGSEDPLLRRIHEAQSFSGYRRGGTQELCSGVPEELWKEGDIHLCLPHDKRGLWYTSGNSSLQEARSLNYGTWPTSKQLRDALPFAGPCSSFLPESDILSKMRLDTFFPGKKHVRRGTDRPMAPLKSGLLS